MADGEDAAASCATVLLQAAAHRLSVAYRQGNLGTDHRPNLTIGSNVSFTLVRRLHLCDNRLILSLQDRQSHGRRHRLEKCDLHIILQFIAAIGKRLTSIALFVHGLEPQYSLVVLSNEAFSRFGTIAFVALHRPCPLAAL